MPAAPARKTAPVSSVEAQALSQRALADAFAKALKRELGHGGLSDAEAAFIAQVHEDCAVDEISGLSPEDLAHLALGFWEFGQVRPDGDPMVRLTGAEGPDGRKLGVCLLEIVQDDAPFLVDSVMGEIAEGGYLVLAMFHPVVEVGRDARGRRTENEDQARRESMIQVLLKPMSSERAEALVQGVRASLADTRAAVSDWAAMRELMAATIHDLRQNPHAKSAAQAEEDCAFLEWMAEDHFVFLGARVYEYPRTPSGEYEAE